MDFLLDTFRRLDGNKALGIDRISKEDYEYELSSNLTELLFRLRRGSYKPRASRIVKIPKADGGERMLAIACIEDKLVQMVVSRILEQIYEPSFIPESFGYRPGKSAHNAIRLLNRELMDVSEGARSERVGSTHRCIDRFNETSKAYPIIFKRIHKVNKLSK